MITVLFRLAARDLRHRPAEVALLLLAITAATATLSVALALRSAAAEPWERTRAATAGPDAVATAESGRALAALPRDPAVRAAAGPQRALYLTDLVSRGRKVAVTAHPRDVLAAPVDRPAVVAGTWTRPGGVVVERAFAGALGVGVGDPLELSGRRLTVAGIAVTTARVPYPSSAPGLIWTSEADARRLTPVRRSYTLALALRDPAVRPAPAPGVTFRSWQDLRDYTISDRRRVQDALLTGTGTLAVLAIACVAVLVGGRMADQTRRVGLLKAVGAPPWLVAGVLLAEHALIAVAAAGLGLATGRLAAPPLARPSVGLLDGAATLSITPGHAATVLLVALGIAVAATLVPAIRGARAGTVSALTRPVRPPRRIPLLIAVSARLPVPLLLGTRLAARSPRRTLLATLSLAVTAAMVVAALALRHNTGTRGMRHPSGPDFVPGAGNPVIDRLDQVVLVIMVAMLLLAAVNTILIAWSTVLDAARTGAITRALGVTPVQFTLGLTTAQLLPAALGALAGIPLGLAVFWTAALSAGEPDVSPPPLIWLSAVLPATLLLVTALTLLPARAASRRPIAPTLRTD